jgi:CubicO group peptidase (beta-lactamase class C family)
MSKNIFRLNNKGRHFIFTIITIFLLSFILSPTLFTQDNKSDIDINKVLQERIDVYKKSVGIVVGIIDEKGNRFISYGHLNLESNKEVDSNTVFEIGSVSKVFTSVLLSNMIGNGELNLNDPAQKYLPKSVKLPIKNGKEITLRHLATHTSGLPRMPNNFAPKDMENPYVDYTVEQMYTFLSNYNLTREIGSKYEYSNLGAGLLGHILSLRAGEDYESLVVKRICNPLNMKSTRIKLTPELQNRLATGHNETIKAVKNWDIPTLTGAGALRSTASDLSKFLAANLGMIKSNLYPAILKTHVIQDSTDISGLVMGLGWHIYKKYGSEIIWHNGGTGGYHSFIGFDKSKKRGVVVLSNSTNSIDDVGLHILNEKFELTKLTIPKEHKVIKLDPKIYDNYIGQYELMPNFILTVTKEADKLFVQATGQPKIEVFPEAENEFFYTVVDAQITFVKDDQGMVTKLILHQNNQDMPAKKVK